MGLYKKHGIILSIFLTCGIFGRIGKIAPQVTLRNKPTRTTQGNSKSIAKITENNPKDPEFFFLFNQCQEALKYAFKKFEDKKDKSKGINFFKSIIDISQPIYEK